ncbi:adenine phosphoribosyltransferase [Kordiimonas sp. SCSIO 12603]|nr:adenine phosphoribosyltransferase [Kordiimonas sp. SCSIO 12603]
MDGYIRTIPDFPKPGIEFKDVTSLFADAEGFRLLLDKFQQKLTGYRIDAVAGIDARGFIIGGALADRLRCGFVAIRKKGKLPADTISEAYELEYGEEILEIHSDAIQKGQRVLLVDDVLATGGTAKAGVKLIERIGGEIVMCAFAVDLANLGGHDALESDGYEVFSLSQFN